MELDHHFFLHFGMLLETVIKLWGTELEFLENSFCPKNWGNGPKIVFVDLKKNLVVSFSLNLFYNKNLFYLLCSCTHAVFGKSLVRDI